MPGQTRQAQRPAQAQRAQPVIPFPRASRKKSAFGFTVGPLALSAAAATPVNPVQIPAQGFLRFIDLEVTGTTAANAANVTFSADAPFNAFSVISLTNAAGDPLQVGLTGYQQFLMNKYGALSQDAPMCDPRADPQFTLVTGAGGTGGSFHFFLRVPCETNMRDAFTAIPNLAANKSYVLSFTLGASNTIYGTPPTTPPSVTINAIAHYWAQPKATNSRNIAQERAPRGNGSVSLWRLQTPAVAQGDKYTQLVNVGNVLRVIIFTLRTAAGVRTDADWPTVTQFIMNDDPMFYLTQNEWARDMAQAFGYTSPATAGGGAAVAAKDGKGTLDTGVYVLYQFMHQTGTIVCDHPRDQYLPTLDATKLQVRGTSYGANAATLEVLTNEIKPISSGALFGKGGTQ